MANCPASCQDIVLIGNPPDQCILSVRRKTLSRVGFYPCNVTLPDPITPENIAPLIEDGTIVFSSKLGNIQWADPTTEDQIIDECSTAQQVITSRELTAEDRIAISYTSGSPATTNDYYDYDFWQDKQENQLLMNYMLVFCDGDVVVPKTSTGEALGATMLVYISYQKPATQGGQWTEFKRISIRFQGDPLAFFTAKPAFNLTEAGITL